MEVFTLDILCKAGGDKIVIRTVSNVVSFKCRCVKCAKSFITHEGLQNHIRNCHLIKVVGPAELQICASIPQTLTSANTVLNPVSNPLVFQSVSVSDQLRGNHYVPVVSTTTDAVSWMSGQHLGTEQLIDNVSYPLIPSTNQLQTNAAIKDPRPPSYANNVAYPVASTIGQLPVTSAISLGSASTNILSTYHMDGGQLFGSLPYSFVQGINCLPINTDIPLVSATSSPVSIQNGSIQQLPDNVSYPIVQDIGQVTSNPAIPIVSTTTTLVPVSKHQAGREELPINVSPPLDPSTDQLHMSSDHGHVTNIRSGFLDISKVDIKIEPVSSSDEELDYQVAGNHGNIIRSGLDPHFQRGNVPMNTGQASGSSDRRNAEERDKDKIDLGDVQTDCFGADATSTDEDIKPITPVALFVSQTIEDSHTDTHKFENSNFSATAKTEQATCSFDETGPGEMYLPDCKCSDEAVDRGLLASNIVGDDFGTPSRQHGESVFQFVAPAASNSNPILRRRYNILHVYPSEHDEKKTECSICGKTVATPENLRNHFLLVHSGNKPFVCNICDKAFARTCDYKRHLTIHGSEGDRHYHTCTLCNSVFTAAKTLDLHTSIQHADATPHICNTCGKMFQFKRSLTEHVKWHHPTSKHEKSLCHFCGVTTSKNDSTRHRLTYHSENRQRFVCPTCGKSFKEKGNLKVHIRTHTGVKPYICDTCGKSFTRGSILVVHKRSHTGERPYVCQVCGKAFMSSSDLCQHRRTVHRIQRRRPYICTHATTNGSICGETFTNRTSYNLHYESSHGAENPAVNMKLDTHS